MSCSSANLQLREPQGYQHYLKVIDHEKLSVWALTQMDGVSVKVYNKKNTSYAIHYCGSI